MKLLAAAVLSAACLCAQTPDIGEIMRRVALNQAKSQELRTSYQYRQKQVLRLVRANGKIAREEHREYSIRPKFRGIDRTLAAFDGKYQAGSQSIGYSQPGYKYRDMDIDGELLNSMANDMLNDHRGRDGIAVNLFPLTYHQQLKYNFQFLDRQTFRGRDVYCVHFEPKKKPGLDDLDDNGAAWAGEALIDAEEYQPVNVRTDLAWKAPLWLKTLLGTNIRGLGFNVTYQKFADGVWFPVSYGGEFEIRAVFFYRRTVTIAMTNSEFKRAEVTSSVTYEADGK
ncbi:MAG TPA: hypothetical protein VKX45_22195 [Bryobacteraceae bacterium]|jgi:hypothetical protein|nr:hypothetical protein [Bryobacteraceae bacterium]